VKRFLLIILLIILLSSFSSAQFTESDIEFCYDFDDVVAGGVTTDYFANYNGTISGTPTKTSSNCASGDCYAFDGSAGEYINSNVPASNFDNSQDFSICFTYYSINEPADNYMFFGYYDTANGQILNSIIDYQTADGKLKSYLGDTGGNFLTPAQSVTSIIVNGGVTRSLCYSYTNNGGGNGNFSFFINDSLDVSVSRAIDNFNSSTAGLNFLIADRDQNAGAVGLEQIGTYDTFFIVKSKITQADAEFFYNNGAFKSCSELTSSTSFISLTAKDNYGNTINTFSTLFNNTLYNTTNGTINTDVLTNTSLLYNVSFYFTNYFNVSYINLNVSNDVQGNTTQSEIRFNITEKITSNTINNYTVNDSTLSNTTTNNNAKLNLLNGSNTISVINSLGYYNITNTFTVNPLDNKTINITLYNHKIRFYAINNLTGLAITSFTINLTSGTYNELKNTTNGNITFNVTNGLNYTSSIDGSGFEIKTANHTNLSGLNSTYQYLLYTTNSLLLRFFHASTSQPFLKNLTAKFIGLTARNESTDNGTIYVDLFSPDAYTILYSSDGYETGKYIVTITNRSYQELHLYLTNDTLASLVLITVKDRYGQELSGVKVTVQRWLNNSWKSEQIVETDFQGRTEAYYILSTVFYNHVLEYEGITRFGAINDDANKKLIFAEDVSNGLNFNINILGESAIKTYYNKTLGVNFNMSYNEQTNTTGFFRFYFSDENGLTRTGCLKVNLLNGTEICNTCSTTSTSTITCSINQSSGYAVYRSVGFIDDESVISLTKRLGFQSSEELNWGVAGYLFGFFLVLVSIFAFSSSLTISLLMGSITFVLLSAFGIMFKDVGYGALIGILAISFLIARIKSEGGQNG